MPPAMTAAFLIERGLKNPREIEISVLGNQDPQASVAGEIIPEADFYSYSAKYLDGTSRPNIPADLPEDVSTAMRKIAVEAYKAIDCAGMARVDFLVDREIRQVLPERAEHPARLYQDQYVSQTVGSHRPALPAVDRSSC